MGTITKKTVFVTEDGEQFDDIDQAVAHNATVDLGAELESEYGRMIYGDDARDVAAWILKRFDRKDPQ